MGHSKNPSKKIECFQQEFAKEEQGPEIQTNKIPQPESVGNEPPFDYSDEDKPYKIRVFPCNMNFSDDSSTDDSDNEFAKEEKEQGPETQTNKIPKPNLEYPESVGNEPPFDYSDEDKPYKIRVFPCKMNFSDDSSTDDSDSEESIGEEEYREKQLEFPPKAAPQEDQTSIEPIEERLDLDFVPDSKTQAIQLAKSSTTELLSGPTIPTSSILVKHGTKRPAEAEVGDEDSKRAKKMTKLLGREMKQPPNRRGRPCIVVTEAVLEQRRLAKQRNNATRARIYYL